ncbi:MAG: SDR family NAD(P)-dependent oxidoreductase [Spirosoma sp.]|nr:SDR family NAD(P)-dependent oxidoreductase [Spirosoma sp.]
MDLQLRDKVILVSGGAKGIGEGICRTLAAEGGIPVIIGRSADDNQKAVAAIEDTGGQAYSILAELTQPEACRRSIREAAGLLGRIDGLINNAGVNDGVGLESGNYKAFMDSLHKNLVHYYLLAHYALPYLKTARGSILNDYGLEVHRFKNEWNSFVSVETD